MSANDTAAEVFAEAATWASAVVNAVPDDAWKRAGLGSWDVRGLVGHTSRALATARLALTRPAARELLRRPEDYFLRVAELPAAGPEAVRDRGVASGIELGDDPAAEFTRLTGLAITEVRAAGDSLVETIVGGMRLHTYLATRTFELVVHGLDICRAIGRETDVPDTPLRETLLLSARLAVRGNNGIELLLAATGRSQLPVGWSVLEPPARALPDGRRP